MTMCCHIKTVVRTRTLRRALELKPVRNLWVNPEDDGSVWYYKAS
jgi:hypothetical protein